LSYVWLVLNFLYSFLYLGALIMFNKKMTVLAGAVVLASLVYVPTVSAAIPSLDYTSIPALSGDTIGAPLDINAVGGFTGAGAANTSGAFNYEASFTVANNYVASLVIESATLNLYSYDQKVGVFPTLSLTDLFLEDSSHTKIAGTEFSQAASALGTTNASLGGFVFAIPTVTLAAGTYYVDVTGAVSTGSVGALNVSVTTDAVLANTPITPVPEPEQLGMLLLGLPIISWMVRRKLAA
jgi:hypothetical protein